MRTIFSSRSIKIVLLSLVCASAMPLQAAVHSWHMEMAASAASIPTRIAARHCAYKNNTKAAAVLNLTADTMNIVRDILYFWNQSEVAGETVFRRSGVCALPDGDLCAAVNGAMVARDVTKWLAHFRESIGVKQLVPADSDDWVAFDDEFVDEEATSPAEQAKEEQQISRLAYAWQVIALPSLEGLTALAVAILQRTGPSGAFWTGQEAPLRRVATAAHSFVRLLDEQAILQPDSPHAKKLYALLMANAIWLAYEVYAYIQTRPSAAVLPVNPVAHDDDNGGGKIAVPTPLDETVVHVTENPAQCRICFDDLDANNRVELVACGHVYCRGCLRHTIEDAEKLHSTASIRCPQHNSGCRCVMGERDIRAIVDQKDPAFGRLIASYQEADLAKGLVGMQGLRHCPTPDCKYQYFVTSAVADRVPLVCPLCHHDYCAYCLGKAHNSEQECSAPMAGLSASDEDKISSDLIMKNTKECPGCHVRIFRFNGCNHMTCRNPACGQEFCWRCNAVYVGPKGHGHHPGTACRLFDDVTNGGSDDKELAPALETKQPRRKS